MRAFCCEGHECPTFVTPMWRSARPSTAGLKNRFRMMRKRPSLCVIIDHSLTLKGQAGERLPAVRDALQGICHQAFRFV